MSEGSINIVNYDPMWVDMFESERGFIYSLIGDYVQGSIEHVGSTAVVGMVAKPIIDIMVGVDSLGSSAGAIELLSNNSYCYYSYKGDVMHWFCKPSPDIRTHHLHLIPFNSPLWLERIAFRDLLRNNSEVASDYAILKLELMNKYKNDREMYTQKKWPFIRESLRLTNVKVS